jgi:hypothetical protein
MTELLCQQPRSQGMVLLILYGVRLPSFTLRPPVLHRTIAVSVVASGRTLTVLAWLNVVLHILALLLARFGMRPGSPLVPLPERLEYLAAAPLAWSLGWATWMLCSAALIAFLAVLVHRLPRGRHVARLALMIAVTAAAFDIYCDSVYILILPDLAAGHPTPEDLFKLVERLAGIGSLVIANGGYSIAILLIAQALRGYAAALGYAVAGFGLVLAAAGFTGVPWHAEWAAPPTIGLYCIWVLVVARTFEPGGRAL